MKYDSDELVKMIAIHEGIVLSVYQDHLGINTVGIGRNLDDRGITDGELLFMNKTMDDIYDNGLTEEEAYYLCMNDIAIVEKELLASKPIVNRLNAVRQMILIDMAFNMGVPRLMQFKNMWLAIEKVNYLLACEEMIDSRWAGQVGSRAMKLSVAMKNGEWI
jgi:lysozyme|tara:strand:+ start:225 stop:710 length:486 start_codon:yes stop_codon:yes gene_type:complete